VRGHPAGRRAEPAVGAGRAEDGQAFLAAAIEGDHRWELRIWPLLVAQGYSQSDVMTYDQVVPLLLERVPELRANYDEHVADNGELLPHVFFGDVSRFVVARAAEGDDSAVGRCLAFLEEALDNGDELAQELVVVSFVENIAPGDAPADDFFEGWPDKLAEWHHRIWGLSDSDPR
jgi:hypothetical protein